MPTIIETLTGNTIDVKEIEEILRGYDINGTVELHIRMHDHTTILFSPSEIREIVNYIVERALRQ